jgi:hypothetical protein
MIATSMSRSKVRIVVSFAMLALALLAVSAACGSDMTTSSPDAGPTATQSSSPTPEQVVREYVDAINSQDTDAIRRLTTPEFRSVAMVWMGSELDNLKIIDVSEGDSTIGVEVTFDLRHGDGSMSDGPNEWGYVLERKNSKEPWLMSSDGVG